MMSAALLKDSTMLSGFDFLVDRRLANGMFAGRNGDSDISVGANFTQVGKTRVDGPPSDLHSIDLGVVAVVNLTLQEVEFYKRYIDLIPRGHSAGIRLSGDGLDALAKILATKATGEYVHIRG
jgi:hypothetical protein